MQAVDIVWIRHDLRTADSPALRVGSQRPVLLLWTADGVDTHGMGAASRVYLHHALKAFQSDLREDYGARLFIFPNFEEALQQIRRAVKVERVHWNRNYEPELFQRDLTIEARLKAEGLDPAVSRGSVLIEPWDLKNKSGQPFKVFTPFYKAFLARGAASTPEPRPKQILAADSPQIQDVPLESLLPAHPLKKAWNLREKDWWQSWKTFRRRRLCTYPKDRDSPAIPGTSGMSVPLHFGQISPRSLWVDAWAHPNPGTETWLRQLIWREFAITSLFHQPAMDRQPIIRAFENFPWADEPEQLEAWQLGKTGYPLVDAGMRELQATGFMHNRLRMIVGSFLVKNLQINWTEGAAFFWEQLVDADRANNSMGWQWVAGCGIDPSPYFRIFNPMIQSERFDHDGLYIKRWVPELARIPARWIHSPWKAPEDIRRLAPDYPEPIVDFASSRQEALMFYDRIKSGRAKAEQQVIRKPNGRPHWPEPDEAVSRT